MDSPETWSLGPSFPPSNIDDWRARLERDLKGSSYDRLLTRLEDAITLEPLYTKADLRQTAGWPGIGDMRRGAGPTSDPVGWQIRQRYVHHAGLGEHIAHDLAGGVEGVELAGELALTAERLDVALGAWSPDAAALAIDVDGDGVDAAETAVAWLEARGALGATRLDLCLDPVAWHFRGGAAATDVTWGRVAALAERMRVGGVDGAALRIDVGAYLDAGASRLLDLGAGLSAAVHALRQLTGAGMSLSDAAHQIRFHLRVESAFFVAIARIRALRVLWSRVIEACGLDHAGHPAHVTVSPARRALTRRDPHVNMLRNTACVFAGAVAGADAICSVTFDAPLGASSTLGRRVARNTQHVLREESGLSRVLDPAGGSWYLEHLTDAVATEAWAAFQGCEAAGGAVGMVTTGHLKTQIEANRARLRAEVAKGTRPITGVSTFPHLEPDPAAPTPAADDVFSLADPFERMRDESDAYLKATGHRPTVTLVLLGTVAEHKARATWSANFVQAGGLEPIARPWPAEDGALGVAILVGADARYEADALDAVKALLAGGANQVWLAGRPRGLAEPLTEAGLTGYIAVYTDAIKALETMWNAIETGGAA